MGAAGGDGPSHRRRGKVKEGTRGGQRGRKRERGGSE